MDFTFLLIALFAISLFTNLTVEAIKKLVPNLKISSTLLAVIVATVLSIATCLAYILITAIPFSVALVFEIVALIYLSFLVATVGYDKVIDAIKQIAQKRKE